MKNRAAAIFRVAGSNSSRATPPAAPSSKRNEVTQPAAVTSAVRKAVPGYGVADFLAAFRFDAQGVALFRKGAQRIGMAP